VTAALHVPVAAFVAAGLLFVTVARLQARTAQKPAVQIPD
jgi:hypothetical protein